MYGPGYVINAGILFNFDSINFNIRINFNNVVAFISYYADSGVNYALHLSITGERGERDNKTRINRF